MAMIINTGYGYIIISTLAESFGKRQNIGKHCDDVIIEVNAMYNIDWFGKQDGCMVKMKIDKSQ